MKLSTRSEKVLLKAVVDTNVFISAVVYQGIPAKILDLFKNNIIEVVISPEIQLEIFTVLPRFNVDNSDISSLKNLLEQRAIKVVPTTKVTICRDQKDNIILEACQKSKADYLITGDKDLLTLKTFKSTKIVIAKEFLKVL